MGTCKSWQNHVDVHMAYIVHFISFISMIGDYFSCTLRVLGLQAVKTTLLDPGGPCSFYSILRKIPTYFNY